jgi:C-terminal processing protease CtpA/Prc
MSERDRDGNKVDTKSFKDGRFRKIKLVVLVNEGSASAAEIFCRCIQDNNRGK